MKKIFLCTTFRDFTGSENDEIQKLFLKSIASQTYKNVELVVTLFGEKNVRNEIGKFDLQVYFYNEKVDDCRYTLSSVINNGIDYAAYTEKDYILLWTTCDVIYDENFFEEIVKATQTCQIGTSHPHITFNKLTDFTKDENFTPANLFSGFDLIFFDSSFFDKKIREVLQEYKFYDWGVFEHFLISLAEFKNKGNLSIKLTNIYNTSKIKKIENDRQLTNEPNIFLIKSHERNMVTFKRFLSNYNLSAKHYDLTYCHLKFRVTQNSVKHFWTFKVDLMSFLKRQLWIHIMQMIPRTIKKFIRDCL